MSFKIKKSYIIILISLIVVLSGIIYYFRNYYSFSDYEKYLKEYQVESPIEYKSSQDKGCDIKGMVLVTENEYLKLYTNEKTAEVAVYDKRNKTYTCTNPIDKDDDELANDINKNYLKSQFIVEYFNEARNTGTMDSYTDAVKNGNISISGLYNGIRYTYELGDVSGDGAGFSIDVEYRLDGDSLIVSVPVSQIKEYGNAKIYRIQLLKYMGAAGTKDQGYMLVPNGSGSIIYFNNGKTDVADYSQYIYGIDPISQDYTVTEKTHKAPMPVFGMSYADKDVLGVIESGASLSFVTASVSGKVNSYNYVYPTFVLRGYDILSMFGATGNEAELPVVENDMYNANLSVRYSFMDSKHTGYSGMANYYRDRLVEADILNERCSKGDIPLFYDLVCSAKKTSHFAGVRYLKLEKMTTFEDAEVIFEDLKAKGVNNQIVNLKGWFNGGFYHDVPDKVKIEKSLGGKSGLERLNRIISGNGGRLYADVAFQDVTDISKRYVQMFEAARYYGAGYVAAFGEVDPSTLRKTSSLGYKELRYTILSPAFLPKYVDGFVNHMIDINVDGIALRDLGNELSSDRKKTRVINREQALSIVNGQFEELNSINKSILVEAGNDYSFAYADVISRVPLGQNEFYIVDEDVPFYEMIIHGYIDYSGDYMNNGSTVDERKDLLNLIEYGASPNFIFTKEDASKLKYTGLNKYYASTYNNWSDIAVNNYNYVNDALKYVSGATIINHEIINNNVRKITYDNGIIIYINYGNKQTVTDSEVVDACSYRIGGVSDE